MRLFFAIQLPELLKTKLRLLQERLKTRGVKGSWTRPELMHLTLAFLGEQDAAAVSMLLETARGAIRGIRPFTLTTSSIGGFPSINRASVLWIGLEESPELVLLSRRLADSLIAAGISFDQKPFTAHITLCRFRLPPIATFFELDIPPESFEVQEIILLKSALSNKGVSYLPKGSCPLYNLN